MAMKFVFPLSPIVIMELAALLVLALSGTGKF